MWVRLLWCDDVYRWGHKKCSSTANNNQRREHGGAMPRVLVRKSLVRSRLPTGKAETMILQIEKFDPGAEREENQVSGG
jgi:hypothetical protein